ncbi:MAG: PTS system mannose/fructose/sorbose family transporter subunit IID [Candidatus Adiutrix sp.]
MFNIAMRSLFLEASWNPKGQQNLGLAAAIDPALKVIYKSNDSLCEARLRSISFFNTNPITSGLAIGVLIKLEENVALGQITLSEKERISSTLNHVLAALGDAFFWQSWLPLCSLISVWAVLSENIWWAPLLLPALFFSLAGLVRFGGLYLGYRRGRSIFDLLVRLKINIVAHNLKRTIALLVGVSTVILLATRTDVLSEHSVGTLWLVMASVVLCVLLLRFLSAKARILHYWYPLFLVATAALVLFLLKM